MKQGKINKETSKLMMEREFDILQSIQGLEPPANLYDKIVAKASGEVMTVSKRWFAGAAAIITILLCMEVFIILQSDSGNSTTEIETLVQNENYQLYE